MRVNCWKFVEQFSIPADVEFRGLPSDLAFDAEGRLYLLGTGGAETVDEVQVFAPSPTISRQKLRYRKGKIAVKIACSVAARCRGRVKIRKGKRTLGSVRYNVAAGKAKKVRVKVTRRGRKAIAARRKHRVTVVVTSQGGRALASRKLTLRR